MENKVSQQINNPNSITNVAVILVYAAIALTVLKYYGSVHYFVVTFDEYKGDYYGLLPLIWWAVSRVIVYLLPILIVIFYFKDSLADYGLSINMKSKYLLIYLGLYLFMLPIIIYASSRSDFQSMYPFFKAAHVAPLELILIWELAYLIQFAALEFFFRGFMLFGLEREIGRPAVYVSMLPYCMIHFGKPVLEVFGAIIAAIVLGELARRSRTIFGGVILHAGVALTMDITALSK